MASAIKGSVTSALDPNYDKSKITVEQLDLKPIGRHGALAFLLRHVFTPAECTALIALSEQYGYQIAMVNIRDGEAVVAAGYRDGERVMIDDSEFSTILFQRIKCFLPPKCNYRGTRDKKWNLLEINERLRFLKYQKGGKFKQHCDGSYIRKKGEEETLITLQIYLNEGFDGGETTFLGVGSSWFGSGKQNRVPVVPETGMILVFEHGILHEGSEVKGGTKYTVRTDVLYQKQASEK